MFLMKLPSSVVYWLNMMSRSLFSIWQFDGFSRREGLMLALFFFFFVKSLKCHFDVTTSWRSRRDLTLSHWVSFALLLRQSSVNESVLLIHWLVLDLCHLEGYSVETVESYCTMSCWTLKTYINKKPNTSFVQKSLLYLKKLNLRNNKKLP